MTTSHMVRLFSAGVRAPSPNAKIVYLDGSWDMFHAGHVALLKEARKVCGKMDWYLMDRH